MELFSQSRTNVYYMYFTDIIKTTFGQKHIHDKFCFKAVHIFVRILSSPKYILTSCLFASNSVYS